VQRSNGPSIVPMVPRQNVQTMLSSKYRNFRRVVPTVVYNRLKGYIVQTTILHPNLEETWGGLI
jgi:hypothetical protein